MSSVYSYVATAMIPPVLMRVRPGLYPLMATDGYCFTRTTVPDVGAVLKPVRMMPSSTTATKTDT